MSLRQQVTKPLVVDAAGEHTHTVVFLHRFPEATTDDELRAKVLSERLTKNHKSLRHQFPTVRWVFPFAKAHARPRNNLSPEDWAAVGMTMGHLPYITQIVLQEADRAGGLDRVILGGQGETAEAAHDAMNSFPEAKHDPHADPDAIASFVQKTFNPNWTTLGQLKLAGFVGMHAPDGPITRDVKNYGIATKASASKPKTTTWDGRRIDDFAAFLEAIGVDRTQEVIERNTNDVLTPKDRDPKKVVDLRDGLNDVQKYALEVAEQEKAVEAVKEKILCRIEADKVERKIRNERERQRRARGAPTAKSAIEGSVNVLGGSAGHASPRAPSDQSEDVEEHYTDGSYPDEEEETVSVPTPSVASKKKQKKQKKKEKKEKRGRTATVEGDWTARSSVRGEMTDAQLAAIGAMDMKEDEQVESAL
ncbi:hypothetical protein CPLU01_15795 [Colletotrichum plurivorum]|uniref:Uncharacterized protein n=1 Tax=Colletotrichum plurivorum TaxID=2175906 RepID=A0A8H6J6H1_9PEZI|nr:hypothetical protein CPLU01_15795 [Colletotrichum plurivorum]